MQVLKISRPTFYSMIVAGKIPGAVKVGKLWRIVAKAFYEDFEARACRPHRSPALSKNRDNRKSRRKGSLRVAQNGARRPK